MNLLLNTITVELALLLALRELKAGKLLTGRFLLSKNLNTGLERTLLENRRWCWNFASDLPRFF